MREGESGFGSGFGFELGEMKIMCDLDIGVFLQFCFFAFFFCFFVLLFFFWDNVDCLRNRLRIQGGKQCFSRFQFVEFLLRSRSERLVKVF